MCTWLAGSPSHASHAFCISTSRHGNCQHRSDSMHTCTCARAHAPRTASLAAASGSEPCTEQASGCHPPLAARHPRSLCHRPRPHPPVKLVQQGRCTRVELHLQVGHVLSFAACTVMQLPVHRCRSLALQLATLDSQVNGLQAQLNGSSFCDIGQIINLGLRATLHERKAPSCSVPELLQLNTCNAHLFTR
jgi:hypothetical protein